MSALGLVPSAAEDAVFERLYSLPMNTRSLVAIAGPPGAGKTSLAERLTVRLNTEGTDRAAILPTDGFLLDNVLLRLKGPRLRKGGPDSFDGGGLAQTIRRLKANVEDEIAVPVYDRALDLTRAGARVIRRSTDVILVDGNYLLSEKLPWAPLFGQFDLTIFLRVDETALRARLEAALAQFGLSSEEAAQHIEQQDLPNARFVNRSVMTPDCELVVDP